MSQSHRIVAILAGVPFILIAVLMSPRLFQSRLSAGEQFASERAGTTVPFDGERAMGYLRQICKLGPRISGSEAMQKQQDLIEQHFTKLGAKVQKQSFQAKQNSRPQAVSMTNLIVTWHPERERRVLFCCHYDTRPLADQEPDRRKWTEPFVSANDGASGVAWLMELGHHMKSLTTNVGVDFIIFDGEEYIYDPNPGADRYFFGSEHFASEYRRTPQGHKYVAGVLLDLVAGADPKYRYEQNSLFHAGEVVRGVWSIARELQVNAFVTEHGDDVLDDHIALNRAGIPTIDIIDFRYPHWHRLSDTPENCSGVSMTNLAKVLTTWATRVK